MICCTPRQSESWQHHLVTLLAERQELTVEVIIGNHDSKTARDNVIAGLKWVHELHEPPFVFKHEPGPDETGYVIAGHIHPVYQLKKGRHQSLRASGFWVLGSGSTIPVQYYLRSANLRADMLLIVSRVIDYS